MSSLDSSPWHEVAWHALAQPRHTWPPLGATSCGGKRRAFARARVAEGMHAGTETLNALYRGAGTVLGRLVHETAPRARFTRVPALLDEAMCPLCDTTAPLRRFLWDGSAPMQLPRVSDVAEVALLVFLQMRMDAHEVVLAVVLLQSLVDRHGAVLQARSARPSFLAACVLALKMTTDYDVTTCECYDAVADHFTALSPLLLARAEEQLLQLLDWRFPNDPELYENCARALSRAGVPHGVAPDAALVPKLYL